MDCGPRHWLRLAARLTLAGVSAGCANEQMHARRDAATQAAKPAPTAAAADAQPTAASQSGVEQAAARGTPGGDVLPAGGVAAAKTAREVVDRSLAFYAAHPKYTVRAMRQERVGGKLLPLETMVMNFSSAPRSVHFVWLDEANEGRECVWVEGGLDNKIVTRGGKSDLLMAGKVIRVDPAGFLARGRGRYSITESGIDKMVRQLEAGVAAMERNDRSKGSVELRGPAKRPELSEPSLEIVQQLPPGADHAFPTGAKRTWYFEPNSSQLQLMVAHDLAGNLLEYYRFDRFIPNPALAASDFDPAMLWSATVAGKESAPVR